MLMHDHPLCTDPKQQRLIKEAHQQFAQTVTQQNNMLEMQSPYLEQELYQYTKEEFFEPIDESPLNEEEPEEKSEQPNYEKDDVDMATAMK